MTALFADPDSVLSALATLFVIVDPLGLVPIFLALTGALDTHARRQVAIWASLIAFAILAFFTLLGEGLLRLLGIGLPAFRVAGGLLLFYTAFEMVFERRHARKADAAEAALAERADAVRPPMSANEVRSLAAFPLAIPLMAGPGAITACILLAPPVMSAPLAALGFLLLVALVCLTALAAFLASEPLHRLLGETSRTVLSRLLGVILAALAVQFVADGVRAMAGT